jgi:hypothetical protein
MDKIILVWSFFSILFQNLYIFAYANFCNEDKRLGLCFEVLAYWLAGFGLDLISYCVLFSSVFLEEVGIYQR